MSPPRPCCGRARPRETLVLSAAEAARLGRTAASAPPAAARLPAANPPPNAPSSRRFAPSVARQISQEVCASMLEGKSWTGDGEEVVWTVQIAEQVKNRLKGATTRSAAARSPLRPARALRSLFPSSLPRAQRSFARSCTAPPSHTHAHLPAPASHQLCPLQDCGAIGGWAAKAAGRARGVQVPVGHGHGQLFHVHVHQRHAVVHRNVLWALQ